MDNNFLPEEEFRTRGKQFERELPSVIKERFKTETEKTEINGTIYVHTVGSDSMILEDALDNVIKALEPHVNPEGLAPAALFPGLESVFSTIEVNGEPHFDVWTMKRQRDGMDVSSADKYRVSVIIEFNDESTQSMLAYDFDLALIAFDEVCNQGVNYSATLLNKLQAYVGWSANGDLFVQFIATFMFNEEGVYAGRNGVDKEVAERKFRKLLTQVMAFGGVVGRYEVTDEEL
jgi:hypothetical protein